MYPETQKKMLSSNTLTLFRSREWENLQKFRGRRTNRPELELFAIQLFIEPTGFHSFCVRRRVVGDLSLVRLYPRVYRPPESGF